MPVCVCVHCMYYVCVAAGRSCLVESQDDLIPRPVQVSLLLGERVDSRRGGGGEVAVREFRVRVESLWNIGREQRRG